MKRTFYAFTCMILILYGSHVLAQSMQVRGSVRDETGPLQGIIVTIKGTQ